VAGHHSLSAQGSDETDIPLTENLLVTYKQ
jgi:hypothetical protein